jgi:hypothetical protein
LLRSLLFSLIISASCLAEVPVVNLPLELRESNWVSDTNEGSCVHAFVVMQFRWCLEDAQAEYWRTHNAGGEWADDTWNYGSNLARKFDSAGIQYAYTVDGDEAFLEWAVATRRGCGITVMGGKHMVYLVHLDAERAGIVDTNDISRVIWVRRDRLIAEWKSSNGWAVAMLRSPAPPLPTS